MSFWSSTLTNPQEFWPPSSCILLPTYPSAHSLLFSPHPPTPNHTFYHKKKIHCLLCIVFPRPLLKLKQSKHSGCGLSNLPICWVGEIRGEEASWKAHWTLLISIASLEPQSSQCRQNYGHCRGVVGRGRTGLTGSCSDPSRSVHWHRAVHIFNASASQQP